MSSSNLWAKYFSIQMHIKVFKCLMEWMGRLKFHGSSEWMFASLRSLRALGFVTFSWSTWPFWVSGGGVLFLWLMVFGVIFLGPCIGHPLCILSRVGELFAFDWFGLGGEGYPFLDCFLFLFMPPNLLGRSVGGSERTRFGTSDIRDLFSMTMRRLFSLTFSQWLEDLYRRQKFMCGGVVTRVMVFVSCLLLTIIFSLISFPQTSRFPRWLSPSIYLG